jgi:hypothetical protein
MGASTAARAISTSVDTDDVVTLNCPKTAR